MQEERIKPMVVIQSAEPASDSDGGYSSGSENENKIKPKRLFAGSFNKGEIPKGMRPANTTLKELEEDEDMSGSSNIKSKGLELSLTHPMVLVAASIGLGFLIAYYGPGLFKPALDKVVKATEELVEEVD